MTPIGFARLVLSTVILSVVGIACVTMGLFAFAIGVVVWMIVLPLQLLLTIFK